ncbi:hypothetical protein FOZ62_023892 [Perkinsus olseni]|uniref:Uncharacterized protein n=1 Tax=Perkinsus olseni TaxID=32597 RepID=A0A7J6T149_PEROL|nr:hypothetical protein FOZ62_023892 [Perkinsus olseni]
MNGKNHSKRVNMGGWQQQNSRTAAPSADSKAKESDVHPETSQGELEDFDQQCAHQFYSSTGTLITTSVIDPLREDPHPFESAPAHNDDNIVNCARSARVVAHGFLARSQVGTLSRRYCLVLDRSEGQKFFPLNSASCRRAVPRTHFQTCELCESSLPSWQRWKAHFQSDHHKSRVRAARWTHAQIWQRLTAGEFQYYYEYLTGVWTLECPVGSFPRGGVLAILLEANGGDASDFFPEDS